MANEEDRRMKDVHTEHCCKRHGCSYGKADCTVTTGKLVQSFGCDHLLPCGADVYDDEDRELLARAEAAEARAAKLGGLLRKYQWAGGGLRCIACGEMFHTEGCPVAAALLPQEPARGSAPPSPGSAPASGSTSDARVAELETGIRRAVDLLDAHLGDSDPGEEPDEYEAPDYWAMRALTALLTGEPEPEDEDDEPDCERCHHYPQVRGDPDGLCADCIEDTAYGEWTCHCCGKVAAKGRWIQEGARLLCGCSGEMRADGVDAWVHVEDDCPCGSGKPEGGEGEDCKGCGCGSGGPVCHECRTGTGEGE